MDKLSEIIQRIKQKLADSGMPLSPKHSSDIEAFEAKYGVRLPEEYRRFLLEIGCDVASSLPYDIGGAIQIPTNQDYDAWHARQQVESRLEALSQPFPFTEAWVWDFEEWDEDELEAKMGTLHHGNLFLADEGCGMTWHLIVTGPERGYVWHFADSGIDSPVPKRNFLTWYEGVLDGVENWWQ